MTSMTGLGLMTAKVVRLSFPVLVMAVVLVGSTRVAQAKGAWWVVISTIPAPDGILQPFPAVIPAEAAARLCGVEAFSDFSAKFDGFAPGFYVTVVGSYATRMQAEAVSSRLRPCSAGAYVRRSAYAGE